MGKGKFKFAWVFDQMEDERERGVTIDTNERSITFKDRRINFVDTPGHLDYIFNMMKGASQVDLAILLIGIVIYSIYSSLNYINILCKYNDSIFLNKITFRCIWVWF